MKSFESLIDSSTRTAMQKNHWIKQVISRSMPTSSHSHVIFCRLAGGRLRITVDSAAWIARLRFNERQLIGALKAENQDIHTVSWHVAPAEAPVTRITTRTPNMLSNSSAKTLLNLAHTLVEDSDTDSATEEQPDGYPAPPLEQLPLASSAILATSSASSHKLRGELLKLAAKLRENQESAQKSEKS